MEIPVNWESPWESTNKTSDGYDSKSERAVGLAIEGLKADGVEIHRHVRVQSEGYWYTLDFLLIDPSGLRMNIEVDGPHHNESTDKERDQHNIAARHVDVVCRCSSSDGYQSAMDVLLMIRESHSTFFRFVELLERRRPKVTIRKYDP